MSKPITETELEEMFRSEVSRWSCGCNAGGMCGCYIDRETGLVHRRDREPVHGQTMRLITEVRRLSRDLRILGEGCRVRKVDRDWPALASRIERAALEGVAWKDKP